MNKWHAWLLQILSGTGAGYTLQREVIHTQTKGGNINTTQREVIIIHTYRQQEVIRYTHTHTGSNSVMLYNTHRSIHGVLICSYTNIQGSTQFSYTSAIQHILEYINIQGIYHVANTSGYIESTHAVRNLPEPTWTP